MTDIEQIQNKYNVKENKYIFSNANMRETVIPVSGISQVIPDTDVTVPPNQQI